MNMDKFLNTVNFIDDFCPVNDKGLFGNIRITQVEDLQYM